MILRAFNQGTHSVKSSTDFVMQNAQIQNSHPQSCVVKLLLLFSWIVPIKTPVCRDVCIIYARVSLTSELLAFWAKLFFVVGGCAVHCKMFSSISGLDSLDASSSPSQLWQQKISLDIICPMSPGRVGGAGHKITPTWEPVISECVSLWTFIYVSLSLELDSPSFHLTQL